MLEERDPQEPVLSLSKGWVLKALREAGNSLLWELYGVDEEELRWRAAEGEWSLKEIAAHLRDAEELALAQHDLEHLWQVRQLKERLREAVSAREED